MKKTIKLNESQLAKVVAESVRNVLKEVYQNTNNNGNLVPINETNAKRMLARHSGNGYALVSACRGFSDFGLDDGNPKDIERLADINAKRTREMIDLIRSRGFSYTLSYGGFIENQGTDEEENVYERSVIIYAEKRNGETDAEGMLDLALEICGRYNQDSVLVKMPGENPKYITRDGSVDMEFKGNPSFNDLTQAYFTDLHKNTEGKMKDGSRATRFSFTESYIAPKPQCYSESHIRHLNGEIFLKR